MGAYPKGTGVVITEVFRNPAGTPTDGTTVTFRVQDPLGVETVYVWGTDPEVTHPSAGTYVLTLEPPAIPGDYPYEATSTGTLVATSTGQFTILADPLDAASGYSNAPCTPWIDAQDVAACCLPAQTDSAVYADAAYQASSLLYQLSGGQFPGQCSRTVRPCSTRCVCPWSDWAWGLSWAWGGSRWICGNQQCGCAPLSRVRLAGYPIRAITEVLIDGVVVDPDTYRLDERRYLTRMRDPAEPHVRNFWPGCQILDLDDDQEGTFSVTYVYGRDPTPAAKAAAVELACQIFLSCPGNDEEGVCILPSGVTQITRQGVTYDLNAFRGWGTDATSGAWNTGMAQVDAFLSTANPLGLKRGPAIWSPDVEPFARPVG